MLYITIMRYLDDDWMSDMLVECFKLFIIDMIIQRRSLTITQSKDTLINTLGYNNLILSQSTNHIIYSHLSIVYHHTTAFILKSLTTDKANPNAESTQNRSTLTLKTFAQENIFLLAQNINIKLSAWRQYILVDIRCNVNKRQMRVVGVFMLSEELILRNAQLIVQEIDASAYDLREIEWNNEDHQARKLRIRTYNNKQIDIVVQQSPQVKFNHIEYHNLQQPKAIHVDVPFYSSHIKLTLLQMQTKKIGIYIEGRQQKDAISKKNYLLCNIDAQNIQFISPPAPAQNIFYIHHQQLHLLHLSRIISRFQSNYPNTLPLFTHILSLHPYNNKICHHNRTIHILQYSNGKAQILLIKGQMLDGYLSLLKWQLLVSDCPPCDEKMTNQKVNKAMKDLNSFNNKKMGKKVSIESIMRVIEQQYACQVKQLDEKSDQLLSKKMQYQKTASHQKITQYNRLTQSIQSNRHTIATLLSNPTSPQHYLTIQPNIASQYKHLNITQNKLLQAISIIQNDLYLKIALIRSQMSLLLKAIL